ncbi:Hsp20/alpha crystallin family protein [Motiliproteus sp. MSK22-1]|uniref:Hsp20/alpha crystallin family protein n=1 Tax=Motiliproteus sp. MSK22-1 TaxID=1897630 RepID=UPI0009780AD9|nr:Hsp20/alpha crystallin family protein [Motiliproteus sp. MSK22-1]OMH25554.1 hypothetical protein BGP75_23630 [Motiliproteus sp. MSK22-1]
MDLQKLIPWNWFKHEQPGAEASIPVKRDDYSSEFGKDPFEDIHREFDRLYQRLTQGWHSSLAEHWPQPRRELLGGIHSTYRPKLNIESLEDRYQVTIDMPGLDADHTDVEVTGNLLVVKGHNNVEHEDKQSHFYRIERASGSFQRALTLPEDADCNGISAQIKNGLMTVTIPRVATAESTSRRIPISH